MAKARLFEKQYLDDLRLLYFKLSTLQHGIMMTEFHVYVVTTSTNGSGTREGWYPASNPLLVLKFLVVFVDCND